MIARTACSWRNLRMKRQHVIRYLVTGTCAVLIAAAIGAALLAARAQSGQRSESSQEGRRDSGTNASGSENPVLLVDALTVREKNVQVVNQLTGQVEPFQTATIASEAAERVVSRPVRRGDHAASGAILATLNGENAQAAVSQERHRLDQAIAARSQSAADYQRLIIETESNRRQARAQVALSLADLQQAQARKAEANAGERKILAFTRQQELHQAENALSQAQIDERLAKIELDRQSYLVKEGAAARDALDRAQAAYDIAVARRKSAEQSFSLVTEGARQEDKDSAGAQVSAAQSQVSAAAQQVEQARAGLSAAETRDARLKAARKQIEGLRAQEMQAEDAVREAQIALARRTIRAPFAGRVLETMADTGDLTAVGTPIIRLGEIARVKVIFAVPEQSRPRVKAEQAVTITADALPGRHFNGRVTALGYQADPKTRCFPIEVTIENHDELLLPNMVARIGLPLGASARRISVPVGAVMGRGGDTCCVFVLDRGYAHLREVQLGAAHEDEIEVLSNLRSGELIAAAPQRLSDGVPIRINSGSE
jgi:RND family efflux transporter MFP subunit